jgi:hypothetical protein
MWGNTLVGPDTPWGIPVDVDFATAYLLLGREIGPGRLTVRGDWFEARDNSFVETDDNTEQGWSATVAYKLPVTGNADMVVELIHVDSDRPARLANGGIAAEQAQTMLQTGLRIGL